MTDMTKTHAVCIGAEFLGVMIRMGGSNTENEVNNQESNFKLSLLHKY